VSTRKQRFETRLIHAGEPRPRILGSVSMPVFQSSTFESGDESSYHDVRYIRLNNTPNHLVLHEKLAALEGAEKALVTSSGMAAVTTTLLSLLSAGDHLLAQDSLYGGTHSFIGEDLPKLGITPTFIDGEDPASWKAQLRPTTRVIYVETMTNPLLRIGDLEAVVRFAREHGLVSIIDNTFASPLLFRPPEHGFDLSLHSCTKFLNGHSDIVAGAVIGRGALLEKVKHKLDHLGGSLDPHACALLHRGMKTLALRMRQQSQSALQLARVLEAHPKVEKVNYPGLESHRAHARARSLLEGGFGGMLSFEPRGGAQVAAKILKSMTLALSAPSLGGVETLVTRPAKTSHAGMPPEERQRRGISDSLIRVSVGIESTEDLLEDFRSALDAA